MSRFTRVRCRLSVTQLEDRLVPTGAISEQIIVDQIGWRGSDTKIVVFADPQAGQNAAIAYTPGNSFEVRRVSDDGIVFTGTPTIWNGGATDPVSGDKAWHGDFSSVTTPGEYYVYDPTNNLRSYALQISDSIYNDVLETAGRMFYYQRSGTELPAQFAGNWTHAVDHLSEKTALLIVGNTPQAGTERDVSGGWWDAGDYNKYVSFTQGPIWDLLSAYEWNPTVFSDAWNIPESGNGIPDILDQVKWETDWLLKMQLPDGSVLNRVGQVSYPPQSTDPASDLTQHCYTGPTTWATASFAASTAHMARVIAPFDAAYAATLRQAAEQAWAYLDGRPNMEPADGRDGGTLAAADGTADKEDTSSVAEEAAADKRTRLQAAAELYRLTGLAMYKTYFEANYNSAALAVGGFQPILDQQFDASAGFDMNRALVTYALTPGATSAIVTEIKTDLKNGIDQNILPNQSSDPYLGYMFPGHYTWGSNETKGNWANLLAFARELNVGTAADQAQYQAVAEEYLHYFHGRNPLSQTYLSNVGPEGADKSVMHLYHSWVPSSNIGPMPGYIPGGANQFYSGPDSPPKGEPPMKAYKDFNAVDVNGTNVASYEVNESAIYSQAPYVMLVSQFASTAASPPPPPATTAILAVGEPDGSVRILNAGNGNVISSTFRPLDTPGAPFAALVTVAMGDLDGDDIADVWVAPSKRVLDSNGNPASVAGKVFVFSGAELAAGNTTPTLLHTFSPFGTNTDGTSYDTGLEIATADLNADAKPDLIAGSRGDVGRFTAMSAGFFADGSDDATIGDFVTPFPGYVGKVIVSAGNFDGDPNGDAEIVAIRAGKATPAAAMQMEVFHSVGAGFTPIDLNGASAGTSLVPFPTIFQNGSVTAVDPDGDGQDQIVFAAQDQSNPTNVQVRVAVFSLDLITNNASSVSTGSGVNGSYLLGSGVQSFSVTQVDLNADGSSDLAVALQTPTSGQVLYLDPLSGDLLQTLSVNILGAGVRLAVG